MNTQTKLVLLIFPIFLVLLVVSLVLFIKAGKKRGRKIAAVLAGINGAISEKRLHRPNPTVL